MSVEPTLFDTPESSEPTSTEGAGVSVSAEDFLKDHVKEDGTAHFPSLNSPPFVAEDGTVFSSQEAAEGYVPKITSEELASADAVPEPERTVEDRLLDEPSGPLTLSTGLQVELRPMKLREFLKLLKIITRGGASILGSVSLDFNDTESFVQELLAIVLFAVPEAEDEVIEFLTAVVKPVGLTGDIKKDQEKLLEVIKTFDNPEMEDVIDVISLLVRTEGRDLQALGKRLRAMFTVAQKMGAVPASKTP